MTGKLPFFVLGVIALGYLAYVAHLYIDTLRLFHLI